MSRLRYIRFIENSFRSTRYDSHKQTSRVASHAGISHLLVTMCRIAKCASTYGGTSEGADADDDDVVLLSVTVPEAIFPLTFSTQLATFSTAGCTGYRGKCALPRFREQEISERLGSVLQDVSILAEVARAIGASLQKEHMQMRNQIAQERARLERELTALYSRMDAAYTDKLDGKITEDFWQRKQADWQAEEARIKSLIAGLEDDKSNERLLNVQRILELAQQAYFLYFTRKPVEQAELLKTVLLNCSIDAVSLYPTYRKPFDLIAKRTKNKEWSGREDLNLRPPGPEPANSIL